MNTEQEKQPSRLQQVNHFSGTNGERIEEHRTVHNDSDQTEELHYQGVVTMLTPVICPMINDSGENQGFTARNMPHEVRFVIHNAKTPQEALDNFASSFQAMHEEMQKMQREAMEQSQSASEQSNIVVPTPEESQSINSVIDPNQ